MRLNESIKLKIIELLNIQEESKQTDDEIKKLIEGLPASSVLRIFNKLSSDEVIPFANYCHSVGQRGDKKQSDYEIVLDALATKDARENALASMQEREWLKEFPNVKVFVESMQKFKAAAAQVITFECDNKKPYHYINLSSRKLSSYRLRNPLIEDVRQPSKIALTQIPTLVINANGTHFSTCYFNDVYCIHSVFSGVLSNVSYENGEIYNTSFEGAHFTAIGKVGLSAYPNTFSKVSLREVNFNNAELSNLTFHNETKLNGVTFNNAKMDKVLFENVSLTNVDFSNIRELKSITFKDVSLNNVSFVNIDLSKIEFIGVTFNDIKLIGECDVVSLQSKLKKLNKRISNHDQAIELKSALYDEVIALAKKLDNEKAIIFLEEAKKSSIFLYSLSEGYFGLVVSKDEKSQRMFDNEIELRKEKSSVSSSSESNIDEENSIDDLSKTGPNTLISKKNKILYGANVDSIKDELDKLDRLSTPTNRMEWKELLFKEVVKMTKELDKHSAITFLKKAKQSSLFFFDISESYFVKKTEDKESQRIFKKKLHCFIVYLKMNLRKSFMIIRLGSSHIIKNLS